jgi:hypothetical protein
MEAVTAAKLILKHPVYWSIHVMSDVRRCLYLSHYFVLYGCETWSLTLREGHRPGVFENRVLKRIFGPKRDEVTGGRRKPHND